MDDTTKIKVWVAVAVAVLLLSGISVGVMAAVEDRPLASLFGGDSSTSGAAVTVDGHSLTIPQVVSVARKNAEVTIPEASMNLVNRSYELLFEAAIEDKAIYGLTRGVGENKDKTIFKGGKIDDEARRLSEEFNANLLRVQSAAVSTPAPREVVRAAMVIRVNTMLIGHTGVQKEVVAALQGFLNKDITPVVPSRGTVGEADIDIMAHVGLALMGEGKVIHDGETMPASEALEDAGIDPIVPFGKDALSIFSSNAYSAAIAVLAVHDAEHLLGAVQRIFPLSLEGLNGNVAPFLGPVQEVRNFPGQVLAAQEVMKNLEGSYLLALSGERHLQDPLSFRTYSHVMGSAQDSLTNLKRNLHVQINAADDNPTVVLDAVPPAGASEQERAYYVEGNGVKGAVFPTSNFEPLPWVLELQSLGVALSHVGSTSVQRTFRLGTTEFTGLSRFLSPNSDSIAYAAIQKIPADLDAENRDLAEPVSTTAIPLAGDIEDTATNAAAAATNLDKIVDNSYYILAVELMHASQAVDLRTRKDPQLALGNGTRPFLDSYRKQVPFLDKDRILSDDIKKSYEFLTTP